MKNCNDTVVKLLSQSFPHKHFLELTHKDNRGCYIGFDIAKKNKVISFMTCIPSMETTKQKLESVTGQINKDLQRGRFETEKKDNYVLCKYTRTLANCFGYWKKEENYIILVNDGASRIQELTLLVNCMLEEEKDG